METKAGYTAAAPAATISHSSDVTDNDLIFMSPNDVQDQYFEFTPVGTKLRPGVFISQIPLAAFEYAFATRSATYNGFMWQIADLSILHGGRFSWGDCERVMAMTGIRLEYSTAKTIASYARNIPIEIRIPYEQNGIITGITIWWHAHVACLPYEAQRELLTRCLNETMTYSQFKNACHEWRNSHNVKPLPVEKPTAARDIIFEQTVELGQKEVEIYNAKVEASQLAARVVDTTDRATRYEAGLKKVLELLGGVV